MDPTKHATNAHKFWGQSVYAVGTALLSLLLAVALSLIVGCSGNTAPASMVLPATAGQLPILAPSATRSTMSSVLEQPGPSTNSYDSPTAYSCSKNYYVSTVGNDADVGTKLTSAWRTLGHAAAQYLRAGSCVNVAPGVYLQQAPLNIAHGGAQASQAGYVTWRCETMPFRFTDGTLQGEGRGCIIRADAAMFALVSLGTSYVVFDGFEIDGNDFKAQRGFQVSGPGVHHSWLLDSDVHHIGQNGISMVWSDWFFVRHDVWHDDSPCSVNFVAPCTKTVGSYGSGLSVWEPIPLKNYVSTAADNAFCSTIPVNTCFHVVIEYNVAYHNYNGQSGNTNTDGEGIIFDTWNYAPFTEAGLIMGNVVYNNGGSGIEVTNSAASGVIVIANNTTFDNHWDSHSPYTWSGEIVQDNGFNVTSLNNIAYAVAGAGILAGNPPFVGQESGGTSSTWSSNFSFPGSRNRFASSFSYPTSGTNKNSDGVDPKLASITPGSASNNLSLSAGSPAIGSGQPFSLWPQKIVVDAGACPSNLTTCP